MLNESFYVKILCVTVVAALVTIKTILFLKISGRKKMHNWFHFSVYQLVNSKSRGIEMAKRTQNRFTGAIFISAALVAVVLYFTGNL